MVNTMKLILNQCYFAKRWRDVYGLQKCPELNFHLGLSIPLQEFVSIVYYSRSAMNPFANYRKWVQRPDVDPRLSTLRIGGKWPVASVLDPIWAYCLICLSDFESRFLNTTEEREPRSRRVAETNQDKQTKKYTFPRRERTHWNTRISLSWDITVMEGVEVYKTGPNHEPGLAISWPHLANIITILSPGVQASARHFASVHCSKKLEIKNHLHVDLQWSCEVQMNPSNSNLETPKPDKERKTQTTVDI